MTLLMALAAFAPLGAPKPSASEATDKLVLSNESITVHFQGKKPMMDVYATGNESRGFKIFLQRLVELAPGDTQGGQDVASLNLVAARNWTITDTEDADGVHVTFKIVAPVETKAAGRDQIPMPPEADNLTGNLTGNVSVQSGENASVSIVFHIYTVPKTVVLGNETFEVQTHEVKFDLLVEKWPWSVRTDVLGLEFIVAQRGGGNASSGTNASLGDSHVNVTESNATGNATTIGWLRWADTASASTGGNVTNVTVRAVKPGGMQGGAQSGSKYWLVYEAPGFDNLTHDPSIGVVPESVAGSLPPLGTPGPGLIPLVTVGALAAIAVRHRQRRP